MIEVEGIDSGYKANTQGHGHQTSRSGRGLRLWFFRRCPNKNTDQGSELSVRERRY